MLILLSFSPFPFFKPNIILGYIWIENNKGKEKTRKGKKNHFLDLVGWGKGRGIWFGVKFFYWVSRFCFQPKLGKKGERDMTWLLIYIYIYIIIKLLNVNQTKVFITSYFLSILYPNTPNENVFSFLFSFWFTSFPPFHFSFLLLITTKHSYSYGIEKNKRKRIYFVPN